MLSIASDFLGSWNECKDGSASWSLNTGKSGSLSLYSYCTGKVLRLWLAIVRNDLDDIIEILGM